MQKCKFMDILDPSLSPLPLCQSVLNSNTTLPPPPDIKNVKKRYEFLKRLG
jgi:hypothetical protein